MGIEITVLKERCKGCNICVGFCPKKILALDTLGKVYVIDEQACINCGQCIHDVLIIYLCRKEGGEMSQARLMQGNEACVEGAMAAGVNFLVAIQLLRPQKLLKLWRKNFLPLVVLLFRWKMKSLGSQLY